MQHAFSGHETFPFRYPWLKKGFDAVRADAGVFLREDAITTLGVGKNMVRCASPATFGSMIGGVFRGDWTGS
jgi:hypothetical protein